MNLKERYFIYPLLFMVVFTLAYNHFASSEIVVQFDQIVMLFQEYVDGKFGVPLPKIVFVELILYFTGYIYGTLSIIVKAREFRGLIMIALFVGKLIMTFTFFKYGLILMLIELISLPFYFLIRKKYKRKNKNKQQKEMLKMLKQAMKEDSHYNLAKQY